MNVKMLEIPIKDIFEGYYNNDDDGVIGYNGKLNILSLIGLKQLFQANGKK